MGRKGSECGVKREKAVGKGDPSCVVLVESSVNSEPRCRVVCGMPRCLASRRPT